MLKQRELCIYRWSPTIWILPIRIEIKTFSLEEKKKWLFKIGVKAIAARWAPQAEFLEQRQRVATLLGLLRLRPGLGRGPQSAGVGHGGFASPAALLAAAVSRLHDLLIGHEGGKLAEMLQHVIVERSGHLEVFRLQVILRGSAGLRGSWKQKTVRPI